MAEIFGERAEIFGERAEIFGERAEIFGGRKARMVPALSARSGDDKMGPRCLPTKTPLPAYETPLPAYAIPSTGTVVPEY
eukprot:2940776-Rhodomonas_salina.4